MKKLLALLLSALILLSLAACSGSGDEAPTTATPPATTPAPQPTAAPTEAPTEPPAMAETVLIDSDIAAVRIMGADHNDHTGMQLRIQCENRSDRTLLYSWDMVSVCGYMYDPFWAEEVAPGKIANSTVYLDTYQLEQMGITSVDEIAFTLRIVDSENWMEAPFAEDVFTIYPTGLDADTIQLPQRTPTEGQVVIADDENLRFVIEWADSDDAAAYTLHVYMENRTDRNLMYAWDQVSVSGFMVDPFWAMSVAAGKKACSEISFYRSDLEENGIQDISDIEFTLTVTDYDNWEAAALLDGTYTYNP